MILVSKGFKIMRVFEICGRIKKGVAEKIDNTFCKTLQNDDSKEPK